jgi:hypothetical protein
MSKQAPLPPTLSPGLNVRQASAYWGVSPGTLRKTRSVRSGAGTSEVARPGTQCLRPPSTRRRDDGAGGEGSRRIVTENAKTNHIEGAALTSVAVHWLNIVDRNEHRADHTERLRRIAAITRGEAVKLADSPSPKKERRTRDAPREIGNSAQLFDLRQAAKKLGISEEQARGLVQDGELQFINVGRGKKRPRMRFTEADLDELIVRRRQKREQCLYTNRKSHRFTSTTSKPEVIGFMARRNAQLARTPKSSKR